MLKVRHQYTFLLTPLCASIIIYKIELHSWGVDQCYQRYQSFPIQEKCISNLYFEIYFESLISETWIAIVYVIWLYKACL